MLVIVGIFVFLVAVVFAAAGVVSNAGSQHLLTDDFAVFNYHVTGSTGTVFLYGILVGAVAFSGLSLMLAGATRAVSRGRAARGELKRAQQGADLVNRDRERLLERQHEVGGTDATARRPSSRRRWFSRGSAASKPEEVRPTS